ncbi:MAG: Fic family protein [Raoultibacter sp.]
MGTLHKEFWLSEGAGRTRAQRRSGAYAYFLPTPLLSMKITLDGDVVGDVGRAQQAIVDLNRRAVSLHSSEGIARLLLRTEAVSSSFIEGLTIGAKRLLQAEMNLGEKNTFRYDDNAAEVVGNIHAMQNALDVAEGAKRVTVDTLLGVHKTLCKGTRIEKYGGIVRDCQNWVGGNSYNPLSADYVPPAPEQVMGLLEDLAEFCNDEVISPVQQAALAHAQFESIHPFIDGNGRAGRALVHLILRRRGLAPHLVPPLSLVLATHAKSYVGGLAEFRYLDSDDPENIQERLNNWVSFFSGACLSACEEADCFEQSAQRLQVKWREKLGRVRKNSALDVLLDEMVGMPLFTVKSASKATARAISAVTPAIERCLAAGIVKQTKAQKRNRAFEVPEVIHEFNIFERRLASPIGDTSVEKPARPVPDNLAKKQRPTRP